MFLHFSRCTDYAFFLGVPCYVPCLFVILLSWPFCLLVFPFLLACLFCFFHFGSISVPSVFCSAVLVIYYSSWRLLALRGFSWLVLAFPSFSCQVGFSCRFCSLVFASLLAFLFVLFRCLLILIHDCAKHFARTRARWSTYLFLVSLV